MREFELESYLAKWEFKARFFLSAADAQAMTLPELLALASLEDRREFEEMSLGYTEPRGAPELREAVASTYDTLGADNIQCFSGGGEALFSVPKALLGADDHAIVIVPCFQSAETVLEHTCEVSAVAMTNSGEGWTLDLDQLAQAIRSNTRLISTNFPNNPTGAIPSREVFDGLIALCREHGLHLLCDELYRGLELDETKRLPQVADLYEKGLSLNATSKVYGLPGLRNAWIASQDKAVLTQLEHYRLYLSLCSSGPGEVLTCIGLTVRDRILARNTAYVRDSITAWEGLFDRFPDLFGWRRPDGGCVAFPKYTGPGSVKDLCETAVQKVGTLLVPATQFRSEYAQVPQDHFRVGLGRSNTAEGIAVFEEFLTGWVKRS